MPETMEEDNQAPQRAVFIRVDIPSFNIQKSNNEEVVMVYSHCSFSDENTLTNSELILHSTTSSVRTRMCNGQLRRDTVSVESSMRS